MKYPTYIVRNWPSLRRIQNYLLSTVKGAHEISKFVLLMPIPIFFTLQVQSKEQENMLLQSEMAEARKKHEVSK